MNEAHGTGGGQPSGPPAYQPPGVYAYPPRPVARRPTVSLPLPVAIETVPGTPFGLAIVGVSPTTSGPATASVVAGAGSILVALVVGCFGILGAQAGWGPMVAGAFAVLAVLGAVAALVLGRAGLRQIRRTAGWGAVTGRGVAVAGIICGSTSLALTTAAFLAALALKD